MLLDYVMIRYIGDETPHADAGADTIGCAFYDTPNKPEENLETTSVTPEKRMVPYIHFSEP